MSVLGLYRGGSSGHGERRDRRMVVAFVVVVVLLVGVSLASFLAGSFFTGAAVGYAAADKVASRQAVAVQLETFRLALSWFVIETGRYPTEEEGLQSLRPFLTNDIPVDPWGRDYIYSVSGRTVTVSSLGLDGVPGNDDLSATLP